MKNYARNWCLFSWSTLFQITSWQSCIKFKKFNSSSVHGIELSSQFKFSSLDKNWTWTAAQLTIELFWTEFKVNSERVECPLVEKRRNWDFSLPWHTKFFTSSVSPELLQSRANICSRKSPFALEGLLREPWYFVKKPYNKFLSLNHFFQFGPLIVY